jgi:hypothetical protein
MSGMRKLMVLAWLAAGCGGFGDTDAPLNQVKVGPKGGVVVNGEATVSIPEGALPSEATVEIRAREDVPAGYLGTAYEYLPEGLEFAVPVSIGIVYDPAALPEGTQEARMVMATLVEGAWRLVPGSHADATNHSVVAEVTHFSVYAMFASAPCLTALDCADLPILDQCGGEWTCQQGRCLWECQVECEEGQVGQACIPLDAVGACAAGQERCTKGAWMCEPAQPLLEICNGLDDDCDGVVDEDCGLPCSSNSDCAQGQSCVNGQCSVGSDLDGDGFPDDQDCDPSDPAVHPAALEVCDGVDNDCDGQADEGCTLPCASDQDCAAGQACVNGQCQVQPDGLVITPQPADFAEVVLGECGDLTLMLCNQSQETVDLLGVTLDESCTDVFSVVPPRPLSLTAGACSMFFASFCPREFGPQSCTLEVSGDPLSASGTLMGDGVPATDPICLSHAECDDGDPCTEDTCQNGECQHVFTCQGDTDGDGIPNVYDNCPTVANPDQSDLDQDGVGDACDIDMDSDGFPFATDCDDSNPAVNPASPEACDGLDNDCDGQVDEGCGGACSSDQDCLAGQRCMNGVCV